MLTSSLGVLGRGEFRDAFVWLDTQRAYLTKSWRATLGLRWVITPRAVAQGRVPHERRIRRRSATSPTTCSRPASSWAFDAAAGMDQNPKLRTGGSRCR